MALYIPRIVSFCFSHVFDVSALSICIVLRLGSRVSSSIFGLMFMGSVMLSICSSSCVQYSAGSGVKRLYVFVRVENEVVCGHVCIF